MATALKQQATVISSRRMTPETSSEEIREIVLQIEDPAFDVKPGQSISVLAPLPAGSAEPHHARSYSIADARKEGTPSKSVVSLCVRRCNSIDRFTGKVTRGIASNYLCNLKPGDTVSVTGPSGLAFPVPAVMDAKLILIGTGTGIAPFRAFVKHLHKNVPEFKGRIWLFYGAKSGLELLYLNDPEENFADYFDRETFEAFHALSPQFNWADPLTWDQAFAERGDELWKLLQEPNTYVYVAGLRDMIHGLNDIFTDLAGNASKWLLLKEQLMKDGRWVELLY